VGEQEGPTLIPKHIGFIMDGNRRWAKAKGLPTLEGHRVGLTKGVFSTVNSAYEYGVKNITLYAFSTENWGRSKKEIAYLITLFREMIKTKLEEFNEKGIKIYFAGRLSDWPEVVQCEAEEAMELTKNNTKMTLNIAFSYGGRAEIVDATKRIIADGLKPDEITEEKFAEYIYEKGQPDLDMVVRTSGEQRTSGFMLWQSAYSEFYFIDQCWPDFDEKSFADVIEEYNRRERRFGK
jgi:undecaprenyl diphosphate synthase